MNSPPQPGATLSLTLTPRWPLAHSSHRWSKLSAVGVQAWVGNLKVTETWICLDVALKELRKSITTDGHKTRERQEGPN